MNPKVLVGVALFFSVVATIIKIVALNVPHFVDVHLVEDVDDKADANRIAGVGVFQSEFDATDPAIADDVAAAGVPPIAVDSPSLEFPLLFPAQENFFPEVLPVNERNLGDLLPFLGLAAAEVEAAMQAGIDGVAAVEFDNCEDFIVDISNATTEYFEEFQNVLFPNTVASIQNGIKLQIEAAVFPPILDLFGIGEPSATALPFAVILSFALPGQVLSAAVDAILDPSSINCGDNFEELDPTIPIVAEATACIAAAYDAVGQIDLGSTLLRFADVFGEIAASNDIDLCVSQGLTIPQCIVLNAASVHINDTPLDDAPEFDGAINVCNGDNEEILCGAQQEKLFYLKTVLAVLQEIAVLQLIPDLQDAIVGLAGLLTLYTGFGDDPAETFFPSDVTFAETFENWVFITAAEAVILEDNTGEQAFLAACTSMGFAIAFQAAAQQPLEAENCATLAQYLDNIPIVLEGLGSDLAGIVAGVDTLYDFCFDFQALLVGFTNAICPTILSNVVLGGLLGTDKELVEECNDDVEDNEKIATAQGFAIASIIFELIAVIFTVAALVLPVGSPMIGMAAGASFLSFLGAILIIVGLIVVQSAPVYEAVGGEPNGLSPVFFTGYVGPLAFVDATFFIISSILLTVAACVAGGESSKVEAAPVSKEENKDMETKI